MLLAGRHPALWLGVRAAGRALAVLLRVIVIVGGGYAFAAAAVALLGGMLARAGMVRSEAVVLSSMAGPLIYLALLCWAFSSLRPWRAGVLFAAAVALRAMAGK